MNDVNTLKFSSSRVPICVVLARYTLLELALMSSDKRAAHALTRTYPGGLPHFLVAVRNKAHALDLRRTNIKEPTRLSLYNTSTASDLAKLAMAAAHHPEIERITTVFGDMIDVDGMPCHYHNTNRLASDKYWNILLSRTGFTRAAGRDAIMALLNARATTTRTADANMLQRLLTGAHRTDVVAGLHLE